MNIKSVCESQKVIFDVLKQAKLNNRLSHAYLFYGAPGTGKKEMALALACMLYCDKCCFECSTCQSIINLNHMNVNYVGIEEGKTKISKEQILDLQEEYSKTSLIDGYRIYIIDGIDTATVQAQNSLLKFIEEPENQTPTIGIFIATELSNVVSTIQSRCVLIHFEAIERKKMIKILEDESIDNLDASLLSCLTNDVSEALDIYKSEEYITNKILFLKLLDIQNRKNLTLYYYENMYIFSDPKNLYMLLSWLLCFFSDSAKYKREGSEDLILLSLCDKIKAYEKVSKRSFEWMLEFILKLFKELNSNISPKNVFFELIEKFI